MVGIAAAERVGDRRRVQFYGLESRGNPSPDKQDNLR